MKKILIITITLFSFFAHSQIIIDNNAPYNAPQYLVDDILLGGGVVATNHVFMGHPSQIGWFNAINTPLGIDSGVVMGSGDVYSLDPILGSTFPIIPNTVTDPDLLAVANSVPPLLPAPYTNSFTVSSINDVAVLEFDFVPTSDSLEFRYAFGSSEYFGWENSTYNDVFGFFLSGPGITGPWANGAVNLAYIPNTTPQLPITISSVNSVTPINQQYFVDNQNGLSIIADADGYTTVFTAKAAVTCGATYHIKLAIADGSDQILNTYVWLEAGSFTSPELSVVDDLGIDSSVMDIACGEGITLSANVVDPGVTFEWYDSTFTVFSTDSAVTVPGGSYVVAATFPTGCVLYSDTLEVISAVEDSLPPTNLKCVAISNGMIHYEWEHPVGADISTLYHLMGADSPGGPYYTVADVYYPATSHSELLSSISGGIPEFCYVTTASPCTETLTSDTLAPISFTVNSTDASCWDGNDGLITVGVDDYVNVLQYNFLLNGVLNTNAFPLDTVFYDLPTGTYEVTVSDNAFCQISVPIFIEAPGFPLQSLVAHSTNTCYDSDLAIAVGSAAGGTPGYSYEWFDSGMNSFSTNDTAFNLSAGSYYLEVMDANGCDTFTTFNVIAPQVPLSASPQVFNVLCKGDSTGMIVGDASGSWGPYTYYWLDLNGDTLQTSDTHISNRDTLFNLSAGTYYLYIEDYEGCVEEYTLNVDEPLEALSIDSMNVISPIACYGDSVGIARLYASGGDPVYSYLWDNGETGIIASSLTSGYHSVLLTDDWGCEVMDSIFVPENTLIESSLLADTTVSCYGLSDGVASISSFGGSSSVYTYFWSTGQQTVGVNSDVASGLQQGSYYVTTRDALGCEVVDSIYISEPEPLSMEALELDWIDCYGYDNGLAFAQAFGGTAPYTFSWDNGTWLGDTVGTLTPGLHTVVVTDARGCTASDTVETHEPPALHVEIDHSLTVLPYCVGVNTASLTAVASGGTLGYTYSWDDNPIQPQTTATAVSLLADNLYSADNSYTITVTDSKGCTASATTDTLQTFDETMSASVVSLSTYIGGYGVSCYGASDGQALVTAQGAHAPYSYQWFGPNGYVGVNDTISNLQAGVYSVTVKDTNDCMVNSSTIITEPAAIFYTVLSVSNDETCLGACDGSIKVDVSGGVSPYVSIATELTTGAVITSSMGVSNDSLVTGICSGTYDLVFSDENGCSSTLLNGGVGQETIVTNNVTIAEIDDFSTVDVLCNGSSTGVLYASNVNTDPAFTYSWQDLNGNVVGTSAVASGLSAGTYVLYADYNNTLGCTVTDTAVVSELPIINPSASITDVDCYGNSSGVLIASAVGGTSPYNLLWNTGVSGSIVTNLSAGTYVLTVTDANNCQVTDTFEINEPDALVAGITQNGYVLTVSGPNGGTLPYSYSWYEQSSPFSSLGGGLNYVVSSYGTYYVEVTDANGCEVTSNSVSYDEGPLGAIDISDLEIEVYPNPFRDEVTIDFGRVIFDGKINLVDVYGKLVETYELLSTDKFVIERTNKSSGIYFIELELEGEYIENIKLIIE